MMSLGPQVTDMEYRETTWPTMSTCTNRDPPHHHNSMFVMTTSTTSVGLRKTLGLAPGGTSQVLWWVSFQYLRHLSFLHLLLLLIMWHLLGHYALCPVSPWWLTCALVSGSPLGIGMLLGGPFDELSCHSWPYLSLSTLHPLVSSPFGFFGCTNSRRGCPSPHGKKGLKARGIVDGKR